MAQETIQYLVLHRRDPDRNMARYYVLSIEPSLFKSLAFTREWGRIGRSGQKRVEFHDGHIEAMEALEIWLERKQRRGYVLQGAED
jgi:predicted DNA-binding WGR domain protein